MNRNQALRILPHLITCALLVFSAEAAAARELPKVNPSQSAASRPAPVAPPLTIKGSSKLKALQNVNSNLSTLGEPSLLNPTLYKMQQEPGGFSELKYHYYKMVGKTLQYVTQGAPVPGRALEAPAQTNEVDYHLQNTIMFDITKIIREAKDK